MTTISKNSESPISIVVFTLNEELNLPVCLDSISWCNDIHVVDSYSSDRTQEICEHRDIPFTQRRFDGFGSQRNWALETLPLKHNWILILDADERVPPELASELNRVAQSSPDWIAAYRIRRKLYMWGSWLRYSSLYPNWVVRFVHRDRITFINRGHSETQHVVGRIGRLKGHLIDENLKGIIPWFERQVRYARKDAEFELSGDGATPRSMELFHPDPLNRRAAVKRLVSLLPFRTFLYFFYSYIIRLGFLDGMDGFMFCRMKAIYQTMIVVNKYDLKKTRDRS